MTTYEAIKAIPAKSIVWTDFVTRLRSEVFIARDAANKTMPYEDEYAALTGVGSKRQLAMWYACILVDGASVSARFIPPSPETLSWGGFLGGETVVLTDHEAAEAEAARIIAMIPEYRI